MDLEEFEAARRAEAAEAQKQILRKLQEARSTAKKLPSCRAQALVVTKIEEAILWACQALEGLLDP